MELEPQRKKKLNIHSVCLPECQKGLIKMAGSAPFCWVCHPPSSGSVDANAKAGRVKEGIKWRGCETSTTVFYMVDHDLGRTLQLAGACV